MKFRRTYFRATQSAFTLVEIAISLAVIGIALIGIIAALPLGMREQRDNREQTVINQDSTVFIQAIRTGARGLDDLTNYVFAITNSWTSYNSDGTLNKNGVNGYDYSTATVAPNFFTTTSVPITNGLNIVGLLSTPEYIDSGSGEPIPNLLNGGISNHVIAYVRSISGPAVEKPPQPSDSIIREDSFSYRIYCMNAPVQHYMPPLWQSASYNAGDNVSYILNGQTTYWQAIVAGTPLSSPQSGDVPNDSVRWSRVLYPQELDANSHELRLTFLWPILPNGGIGTGRQTYRVTVPGQIVQDVNNNSLYFYQSQTFANAP
jgi:type II secretory pathway pseudopilin PulG